MLSFLEPLRLMEAGGLTLWSVLLRMSVAMICGGIIGVEREFKRRPAGFRTHILICMGAAATTMTSQYLYLNMQLYTDMARLGAQVIAGMGFIGAGTIIVTKQRQVKGLTTAAGLWTCAIIGLAAGAGYYEAALLTMLLILLAEIVFSRIEYYILATARTMNVFMEYIDSEALDNVLKMIKATDIIILDLEITKTGHSSGHSTAILALQTTRRTRHEELLTEIARTEGILSAEEL
ncbi:MAG: MgtC/SapB family protein [Clostridia bacterium]|nr:MgtC/SapB family protein [Clostridia bacterium]